MKTMLAAAASALLLAATSSASATPGVTPVSDTLMVLNAAGVVVALVSQDEAGEGAFIYLNGIPADPSQFGHYTLLTEPSGVGSDAFGVAVGGPAPYLLGFQSDGESGPFVYGDTGPITLHEGGWVNGTQYLDPALQAQGDTAWFFSDGVPEPATWAMMLGGFALIGSALRRRKALVA